MSEEELAAMTPIKLLLVDVCVTLLFLGKCTGDEIVNDFTVIFRELTEAQREDS